MGERMMKKGFILNRKIIIGVAILLVVPVAIGLFLLFEDDLVVFGIRQTVAHSMVHTDSGATNTGMRVILLGTGSPLFDKNRTRPCSAVIAGGRILIFDAGLCASRQFGIGKLSWEKLDAVFLTHVHDDHFAGLGQLILDRWMQCSLEKKSIPLEVYGPYGTAGVVNGFSEAYKYQNLIRSNAVFGYPLSGSSGVAREVVLDGMGKALLYDTNGLRVYAFLVDHSNPFAKENVPFTAFAYRVEYRGRAVVFSGDYRGDSLITRQNLELHSMGADVLVMEMYPKFITDNALVAMKDLGLNDYARQLQIASAHHATDIDGAQIAQKARVKKLVFNHLIPTDYFIKRQMQRHVGEYYKGEAVVSEDFMEINLPPME
jgi:ribonuclease Z